MRVLGITIFSILSIIAAIHVYWGLGGLWPGGTEQALINTVLGNPRATSMPSSEVTFIVAFLIFSAGLVALIASRIIIPKLSTLAKVPAFVLMLIFMARGAIALFIGLRSPDLPITEPFRTYDLWMYSPLCLIIGVSFGVLVFYRSPV